MSRSRNGMKWILLAIAAVFLVSIAAVAQEGHDEGMGEMPPMGAPEQMKEVQHLVGTWDVQQKFKMDPAADWQENSGVVEYALALDGCALTMHFSGEMLGMPFKGMMVQTYSREYQQWQAIWIDNMGAAMTVYTGNMKGNELVMEGTEKWAGAEYLTRLTTYNMKDDSYDWKYEQSMDGGKTWDTTILAHYTKRK